MSLAASLTQPHRHHAQPCMEAFYIGEGDDVWEVLDEVAALSRGRGALVEVLHDGGRVSLLMGDGVILAESPMNGLDRVRGRVRVEAWIAPLSSVSSEPGAPEP